MSICSSERAGRGSSEQRGSLALEARALTKHFKLRGRSRGKAVHAVDGVDLQLHRGTVVALVGESGSGKSTIAKLLSLLIPRTSGDILLDGTSVHGRGRRAFKRHASRVQMIFQDPFASLNPVHTVRYTLTRAVRIMASRGTAVTSAAMNGDRASRLA